jgi:hypothetical protein
VPEITPLKVLLEPVLLTVSPPAVLRLPPPITFVAVKLIVPLPLVASMFAPFERLIILDAFAARVLFGASVIAPLKVMVPNSLPGEPIARLALKSAGH